MTLNIIGLTKVGEYKCHCKDFSLPCSPMLELTHCERVAVCVNYPTLMAYNEIELSIIKLVTSF